MTIQAVAWAIEVRVGDPTLKVLLIAIANHASSDEWLAWPKLELLAHESEISKRTVQRALDKLQAIGLIEITPRYRKDGSQTSSLIRIISDGHFVTPPPPRGQFVTGGGDTAMSPPLVTKVSTPNEPSENRQIEKKRPSVSRVDFDEWFKTMFWPAYPKRFGQNPKTKAADKLFLKIKSGENPETIMAGVARLVAELKLQGKLGTQFVPQAITWINGKGWDDDPMAAGQGNATFSDLSADLRARAQEAMRKEQRANSERPAQDGLDL